MTTHVVFDLFGTLVPQFPRVEHDRVLDECSRITRLDTDRCRRAWRDLYPARIRGQVKGIAGHLDHVAGREGVTVDRDRMEEACAAYRRFVKEMLVPTDDAREALASLESRGTALGLLSNAHDDVADAFETTALGRYFNAAIFSCRLGHKKPDNRAYTAILSAMGMQAGNSVTYVGDGSDDELSGAAAAGMRPVLVRADLSNAYDHTRPHVEAWTGEAVDQLTDLPKLLS